MYTDIARSLIQVEPLPPGAAPIYDRDLDVAEILTSSDPLPAGAIPTGQVDTENKPKAFPDWVKVGTWVRFKGDSQEPPGRIGQITDMGRPDVSPINPDPIGFVHVQTWRIPGLNGLFMTVARIFTDLWEPCEKPPEPRTAWDRMLDED